MQKILFPTDFSPAAHNAYRYAMALAKETGAIIELMHVYTIPFTGTDLYLDLSQQRELRVQRQMQKEALMTAFVEQYDFNRLGDKLVYPGLFIEQEIIDRSGKGVDLIVMGTKGERNPLDKFLGSVTTQLMMNANCPVLAIPENATYEGIQNIAYATTFGYKDQPFVEKLAEFAQELDAQIHFVHVSDDSKIAVEETLVMDNMPSNVVHLSVVNGETVMEGIDHFLDEHRVDILALYMQKRKLWERLFHSSFTRQMTFHTSTPLFVFHE